MNKTIICALITSFVISGCASSAKNVPTSYVPTLAYQNSDCSQLNAEAARLQARILETGGRIDKAADNDKVLTGVALLVFWPAIFFLGNKTQEAEFGRLKGEYEAITKSAIEKHCAITSLTAPKVTGISATKPPTLTTATSQSSINQSKQEETLIAPTTITRPRTTRVEAPKQLNSPVIATVATAAPVSPEAVVKPASTVINVVATSSIIYSKIQLPVTGFAEIGEVNALPTQVSKTKTIYSDWLVNALPRAFVLAGDGSGYGSWSNAPRKDNAEPQDPAERALYRCEKAGKTKCKLYAIDNNVVWVK